MAKNQRPVVSIIPVRNIGTDIQILLQRRSKESDDTPYDGYLELPQGKVKAGENLTDAAQRELQEESGLRIERFIVGAEHSVVTDEAASDLFSFNPLICVFDREQNHLGIAVVVTVRGEASATSEAVGHEWHSIKELPFILANEPVFPLNRAMIAEFMKIADSLFL
ncbi:NUDIX hydrolase [Streptosporangium sp. NPDC023963]|uniref:NUDIX hydrolase n=1 Tax=Streptosporangium sp. NPDC023963 TaxID=3155608 RepID=UPI00344854A5